MVNFAAVAQQFKDRANRQEYLRDPVTWATERMGVYLWSAQREILGALQTHKKVAVKTTHSIGKALPLDTPIPTPDGWTTMGELSVGDSVLGQDGKPTTVTYVSPVQRRKTYELTFNDGSTMVACAEHQWNTLTMTDRQRAKRYRNVGADWRLYWDESRTRTTQQIVDTLLTKGGQPNHLIPVTEALDLPDADLPIDPYVFGAWLGDGTSIRAEMTIGNDGQHIIDEFAARGHELVPSATSPMRYSFAASLGKGVFLDAIRELGVYRNKHIPTAYLRASKAQRREVLRGLLDTDGFVVNTSSVGIDLASERLAHDTAELIRSLGYKVNVREGTGSSGFTRYRLAFTPDFNPFTPGGHKHKKFSLTASTMSVGRATARTIVAAREVEPVDSKCITVDNERSLYLAGEHFIVTHNTYTCALAVAWWVDTRGSDGVVISSAPTYDQVSGLLWEEIRKFHATKDLPGRVTQDNRWQYPLGNIDVLVGQGRKPADTNIHGFQGYHRPKGVLVVLDEACGIPDTIYTGSEAITTGPYDRILAVGNPDDPNTEFGRIFREKPDDWYLITVSAFDTPNFTGEWVPDYLAASLPQPAWVESRRKDWGEDSPRYKAKILAEFPETSDDSLFNRSLVEAATKLNITKNENVPPVMGVDIARYGSDRNTAFVRYGNYVEFMDSWVGMDLVETAEHITSLARSIGCREVRVDAVGIGAGVADMLARLLPEAAIYEMNGSESSPDRTKWYNARAYWYDKLREQVHAGELKIPEHNTLIDEFGVIKYSFRGSSIIIESKEDMRKRGIKSPDFLDAVVYACADVHADGIEGDRIVTEADIFDEEDLFLYDEGREPWSFVPF